MGMLGRAELLRLIGNVAEVEDTAYARGYVAGWEDRAACEQCAAARSASGQDPAGDNTD
jgi:hypothetical protein